MSDFNWFSFVRVDNTRHTHRASSAVPTGGNTDRISISHGETRTLLEVDGPGCITHIWFTSASVEEFWLRKLLLKIYWDDEEEPSVLVPVGDFFGVGHAQTTVYTSLPMAMAPMD